MEPISRDDVLELLTMHDIHSMAVEILARLEIDEWDVALCTWRDESSPLMERIDWYTRNVNGDTHLDDAWWENE